jgi:hypothetical protein
MPENQQPTEPFIFEFQHTDENGQPIIDPRTGRQAFTNLTGADANEVLGKLKDSYINVARAFNRVRNQKPVPLQKETETRELSAEEERQAAIDLQDPSKARLAARKLTGIDDLEARQKRMDEQKYELDTAAARLRFVNAHGIEGLNDYYPCQANSAVLMKYIADNNLDPRVLDNYETAFNATQHQLASRPTPQQATPPANEPPINERPAPAKTNGGIQPGSMNGGERPKRTPKNAVTKEALRAMQKTPEGRAEFKRRMKDPAFVAEVNALGYHPAGNFI